MIKGGPCRDTGQRHSQGTALVGLRPSIDKHPATGKLAGIEAKAQTKPRLAPSHPGSPDEKEKTGVDMRRLIEGAGFKPALLLPGSILSSDTKNWSMCLARDSEPRHYDRCLMSRV